MQTFADWGAEYVKVDSCARNCTAAAGMLIMLIAYRCLPLTDARCALRGRKCDHLRAGALEPVHQRDQEDREGDGLLSRRRDCHCDDTPLFYRY